MEHYLLIDLGTGSTRAALITEGGTILSMRSFANRYYRDEMYPDAQFFLPFEWENELMRCCIDLALEYPDIHIRAVSAAGARQSLVLLDRNGRSFYGLPNIDNRGREFMSEVQNPDWIYERSGKWVTEDFCAAKLFGLKKKRPSLYAQIDRVLSLSEWVGYLFTGETAFEPSQACETQLYDLETGRWSEKLCKAYDIDPSILPPLLGAGQVLAPILPLHRESFGMTEDAVFLIGGADTQCALMQANMQPGDIAVVSGTTTPCTALVNHKYYDPEQRVWTDANLNAEGYLIEMNPGVTGLNYQRLKEALCPDISYAELERAYRQKHDFGCTASFSSLLFYEQRSLRQGGFFMRSPFQADTDRIDLMWAALADIACATYEQLWRLCELSKHQRNYIMGCGGGFRSHTLCQMLSDLSGLELHLLPGYEQATLLGLTAVCNKALGINTLTESTGRNRCFQPQQDKLIHRYHPIWNQNRLHANET